MKVLELRFGPAPAGIDKLVDYMKFKDLNEYEVDQIARQEGMQAIKTYPGRAIILSLGNFIRLWFSLELADMPSAKSCLTAVVNSILLGLAGAAFVFFRGAWLQPAVPLIVLVGFNTVVYTVVLGLARFNTPVMPYFMLFAAQTLIHLLPRFIQIWQRAYTEGTSVKLEHL
jgi:hypothetical protein